MTKTDKLEIQKMIEEVFEEKLQAALCALIGNKDFVNEVVEDYGLCEAVKDGMATDNVDKVNFMNKLEKKISK